MRYVSRAMAWWGRLVSADEIASSRSLRGLYWALLGGFVLTFHEWAQGDAFTRQTFETNRHLCWPYFQECGDWHVLSSGLDGVPQTLVYAILLGLLTAGATAAWRGRWAAAHAFLVPAFAWKIAVHFLFTFTLVANYHYFHLALTAVFLLGAPRLLFLRRTLALMYLLSAVVKLNVGWIGGTYFTSTTHGLPLVPDVLVPVATSAVLLLETVGAVALLSPWRRARIIALVAFAGFHLYSAILVGYLYPAMCLPPLLLLFAVDEDAPRATRLAPAWIVLVVLMIAQSLPALIRGDARMTLEGNAYGLHMFEANHQCVSTVIVHASDGSKHDLSSRSAAAGARCSPYAQWFTLRRVCSENAGKITRIEWRFDHSINDEPLYRIVDVPDACPLEFAAFRHNRWITLPEEGAKSVGLPDANTYR